MTVRQWVAWKPEDSPDRFLNYRGDRRAGFTDLHGRDRVLGPDLLGRYWKPIAAEYDPATDRTRVEVVQAILTDVAVQDGAA